MIATRARAGVKGLLYDAKGLLEGSINGRLAAMLAGDRGLVVRIEGRGVLLVEWGDLLEAVDRAWEEGCEDPEGWTPLRRTDEATNVATGEVHGPDETGDSEIWGNSLYTVHVRRQPRFVHLSYHRHDRAPCRDWRHGQRIKNEVVGPEYEAVEIYPADSRLVDGSNQYHLWVALGGDGGPVPVPFGFNDRLVLSPEELATRNPGAVQRPFEEGEA